MEHVTEINNKYYYYYHHCYNCYNGPYWCAIIFNNCALISTLLIMYHNNVSFYFMYSVGSGPSEKIACNVTWMASNARTEPSSIPSWQTTKILHWVACCLSWWIYMNLGNTESKYKSVQYSVCITKKNIALATKLMWCHKTIFRGELHSIILKCRTSWF